jgi:isopentenyl diphosphate isomerase/L-lactate dehydrogenase-like FMN-dependent dehydrogenase
MRSCGQIEVLREIVLAVAGRVEVYLDGGVTEGTDALKVFTGQTQR